MNINLSHDDCRIAAYALRDLADRNQKLAIEASREGQKACAADFLSDAGECRRISEVLSLASEGK
jgi:hypothetical protein